MIPVCHCTKVSGMGEPLSGKIVIEETLVDAIREELVRIPVGGQWQGIRALLTLTLGLEATELQS
jgi:hypothetical protein